MAYGLGDALAVNLTDVLLDAKEKINELAEEIKDSLGVPRPLILSNSSHSSYVDQLKEKLRWHNTTGIAGHDGSLRSRLCGLSDSVDRILFYRLILIPAAIFITILSLWFKRIPLGRQFCGGRLALVFPVKLLSHQKHRFSYVAAFTFTSWVMLDVILSSGNGGLPFYPSEIMPHAKSFYLLVAGIQYALIYYPIFASLTSDQLFGYLLGTLYTWTLATVFVIGHCICHRGMQENTALLENAALLPPLLSFLYLSISFPCRIISLLWCRRRRKRQGIYALASPEWEHVKNIWQSRHGVITVSKRRWYHEIYCPMSGFKYSISALTGATMGSCFVFMACIQILHKFFGIRESIKNRMRVPSKLEQNYDKLARKSIVLLVADCFDVDSTYVDDIYEWIVEYMKIISGCAYASLAIAALSVLCSLLLTLRSYKRDMLLIYRGRHTDFPRANDLSPRTLLLNGVRYVGYQTAYATWGLVLQFLIIFAISGGAVSLVVIALLRGWATVLLSIVQRIWVGLVIVIFLFVVQNLLALRFFTIKEDRRQKILAIRNRNLFFNFHYFAVFANTAIGFISCPVRILKATLFGLWTLPRLDTSPLGRNFEIFDPGYMSYICLLHLENAHQNPTMLVAGSIMLQGLHQSKPKFIIADVGNFIKLPSQRQKLVRNRWHLYRTLYSNPSLRLLRKSVTGTQSIETCDFSNASGHLRADHACA